MGDESAFGGGCPLAVTAEDEICAAGVRGRMVLSKDPTLGHRRGLLEGPSPGGVLPLTAGLIGMRGAVCANGGGGVWCQLTLDDPQPSDSPMPTCCWNIFSRDWKRSLISWARLFANSERAA